MVSRHPKDCCKDCGKKLGIYYKWERCHGCREKKCNICDTPFVPYKEESSICNKCTNNGRKNKFAGNVLGLGIAL